MIRYSLTCRRPPRLLRGWPLLACLLITSRLAPGQSSEIVLPAEKITVESGLNAGWVLSMEQDRRGFMWFGTNLGLVRHDGLHYKVYRRANTLPRPLSSDYIFAICEDPAGDLWLGTTKGLNHFHVASETFTVFRHDAKDPESLNGDEIFDLSTWSSRPDCLWVATTDGGLGLFDTRTGKCRSFRADPSRPGSLRSDEVRMVLEDSGKTVWVATAGGLHRFLPETESFEVFRHGGGDANSIASDDVFEIFESKSQPGILWIGTGGNSLNRFDLKSRSWRRFTLPATDLPAPLGNAVYFIRDCPHEPDVLLVGAHQGLFQFDMRRGSWQRVILQDQFQETGNRRDEMVLGIFRDRSGMCWVCMQGRGLFKFLPQPALFRPRINPDGGQDPVRRNRMYGMAEDPGGRLWLATGAGLYRYDPEAETYEHFTLAPAVPVRAGFDSVLRVCCTREGEVWAATGGGLVRLDPRSGGQEVFAAREGDPATLGFSLVAAMAEDSQGFVWICSDFCLLRWDPRARIFARYQHDPGNPGSLSASHCNPVMEDRGGNVWIGTENGLNRYDRRLDRFARFYLDPPDPSKETQNYIMGLHQDARGRIWVATSNGLNLMETEGGVRFRHYAAPGSTLRNFVLGLVEDDNDNLWISSSQGLSRFDMVSRTFSHYDGRDGVPSSEFIYGSCLRSQTGELYFGGMLGMFSFKPWLARFNRYRPLLAFTDIQLWRQPVAIGGASPLPASIVLAPDLDLAHTQNSLTVSFAALSYIRPEKNQYAYRLDGRDSSWTDLGFEHSVNLDNLRPGRYRLRIRGANNEGVWNEEGISLAIRIRPPFWETWWFRALAALAIVAFFVQLNRTRARRLAGRIRTEAAMDHYCEQYRISAREREIIRLLLKGKSNREIEDTLFISMGTVKNHIYSIFQKLGVKNRGQLTAFFKNLPAAGEAEGGKAGRRS